MMDNPEKQGALGTRQTKMTTHKTCNSKTISNTEHPKQPRVNPGARRIVSSFCFLKDTRRGTERIKHRHSHLMYQINIPFMLIITIG